MQTNNNFFQAPTWFLAIFTKTTIILQRNVGILWLAEVIAQSLWAIFLPSTKQRICASTH